jgi:acyl dehydratase
VIAPTLHSDALNVGDAVPAQERTFTTVDLVAYGAATWDWHRLHYDIEYARSVKLPNVIIDGQAYGALFAKALLDWLGPQAFIRKLSLKYRSMAFAGDPLRTEGEITAIRVAGDAGIVTIAQRIKTGDRVVAEATAEVRLPQ